VELITILLSGLLTLISPIGLLVDQTAEKRIRSQLLQANYLQVQQLEVRTDNAPAYQLLQGKVNRVRIAGKQIRLKWQDINLTAFELETDALQLNPHNFKLKRPLQAAIGLTINQKNANKILQSPAFLKLLKQLEIRPGRISGAGSDPVYKLVNPKVEFITKNRLIIQVELREGGQSQAVLVKVETGVRVVRGRRFQAVEPVIIVNGEKAPAYFVDLVLENVNKLLDLSILEGGGILARILKLDVSQDQLQIAAFLRVEPSSQFLETRIR
jgi:LmeA-like phospholipid-binding